MAAPSQCPTCATPLPAHARFCMTCGTPASSAATGATIAVNAGGTTVLPQAPSAAPWQPGTTIGGHYRIERALGRGGFGQTYLATDAELKQRKCVIKRMLVDPNWSAADERTARANFRREAELLADLNEPGHANIPEIYAYLEDDSCLVMKYIEGKNFDNLNRTIQAPQILAYMRDICGALVYMHSRVPPVLHRDIKPDNLLLANDGRIWLIDFGLSKSTPLQTVSLANSGTMMAGTLGYTPPEQWQSAAVPESDVYALAATLHTLLTGYEPNFTIADLPELITRAKGAFPRARSLNPALDSRIDELIERCMAIDSTKRPTAAEFLHEIKRVLHSMESQTAITTPDKQRVSTPEDLARWCYGHWQEACEWLQGQMPNVIESGFLDAYLAKNIRQTRLDYQHDHNAALDMVIDLLDPATRRVAAIQLTPNPINFGSLAVGAKPAAKEITIANSGQRYLALKVEGQSWLRTNNPHAVRDVVSIHLIPGAHQKITIYANVDNLHVGGKITAKLSFASPNGLRESHKAVVNLPRWKTFWVNTVIPALKVVVFKILVPLLKRIGKLFSTWFEDVLWLISSRRNRHAQNFSQSRHNSTSQSHMPWLNSDYLQSYNAQISKTTNKKRKDLRLGVILVVLIIISCLFVDRTPENSGSRTSPPGSGSNLRTARPTLAPAPTATAVATTIAVEPQ
jgi:serine/threonine protein kinase